MFYERSGLCDKYYIKLDYTWWVIRCRNKKIPHINQWYEGDTDIYIPTAIYTTF